MIIKPKIEERGSGPTIEGTRTTVYHVMDYYVEGMHPTLIAAHLGLGTPDIEAAIEYIDAHRPEVDVEYRKILERCERGNPPEVQAKIDANRPAWEAKKADILRKARERSANGSGGNGSGANGSHR